MLARPSSDLLARLAAIGWTPDDDADTRLRKATLTLTSATTGPVVAGVIGQHKFAYDLWGDAVYVASRMESQGLPGQVQVSLATWELLQGHYRARYRGSIDAKGRGEMGAYLLLGRRDETVTIAG